MIAELFYPKELKQVIADLRAKDDLNEEALKHFNWPIHKVLWPIFLLIIFVLFGKTILKLQIGAVFPLFILIFLFVYVYFYIRGRWKTFFASYIFGHRTKGVFESARLHVLSAPSGQTRISVMNSETKERHLVCWAPDGFVAPDYTPKKGQEISYYLTSDDSLCPNPAMFEYMKKYCFSKSKLQGERNG